MAFDLNKIKQEQREPNKVLKKNMALKNLLDREIVLVKPKLSDRKKEAFFSEMHTLLSSGIDMKSALEIIVDEQKKKKDKELFEKIREKVIDGVSFSVAVKESKMFSSYEYFSLKIGEESGQLSEILVELSDFLTRKIKQRRQLVSSMSYPVLVLITAVTAVLFMLKFIVPMFQDVYKRFGGELPGITKSIISISNWLSGYFWWILFFIAASAVFLFLSRSRIWYKRYSALILLKVPLFGMITQKVYLARFCQAMSLLISSHIPMLNAIELVRNMISFYPLQISLNKIEKDILLGNSLHKSMSEFKIFDKKLVSMIKVGEEVNQLDVIFSKLNKQYSDEIEHKISILGSVLEPALIIFVGGIVGVILVSMYLPLFQISTSVYGM